MAHRWTPFSGSLVIGDIRYTANAERALDIRLTCVERCGAFELVYSVRNGEITPVTDEHPRTGSFSHGRNEPSGDHLSLTQYPLHTHRKAVTLHMSCELTFAGAKAIVDRLDQCRLTCAGCPGENIDLSRLQVEDANTPAFANKKDV
ncbi:hypothetical protein D3C76_677500 [compost metagenome]